MVRDRSIITLASREAAGAPSGCYPVISMTKVQVRFRVQKPLDDTLLAHIAEVRAVYGIQSVKVAPSLDSLTVEYDATRLRPAEVESVLAGAGIPVEPG